MKKPPLVTISILHVNGKKVLEDCLSSLKKTNYPNFEINLLLNSTSDDSESVAKKYKVNIYKSKKNLGFAGGHNLLFKKAKGKYVVVMNNDVEVERNWLKELVDFAEKNKADVCQPKVRWLRDKQMFEHAGAAGGFMDIYGYPFYRGYIFSNNEEDKGQYDSAKRIFWACGSCMMIKKDILRKSGVFDEDFFMYGEEFDLCWRINVVGGKIYCVPSSIVYHLGEYTIKDKNWNMKKEYLLHRNVFLAFLKNYSPETKRRLVFRRWLLEIVSGLAFPKKIIPVGRALFWIIKNKKIIDEKNKNVQKKRKVSDEELQKLILKNSIAWLFFVKGKKTFKEVEEYFNDSL